jgi:hypothetical protein
MSLSYREGSIPGCHRVTYRILDATRSFPVRAIDVLATEKEIAHFVREGFLVRERLFPEGELARLRAAFDDVFASDEELEHGGGTFTGTFARHLADKHPAFLDLVDFAPFVSVARALLGPSVQSRGVTGRLSRAGVPSQETEWHFHQRVIPEPLPPLFMRPQTVDVLVYLDDARGQNGPICVLPGSHLEVHRECAGGNVGDLHGQVTIEPEAGTCVFTHGSLWHRAMPTGEACATRRLLIQSYGVCWMKPSIYGSKPRNGLTERLGDGAGEEMRELLGERGYM